MYDTDMRVSYRYYFKTFWKDYTLGILCLLGTNMLAASIPMLIKRIIELLQRNQTDEAKVILLAIAGIIVAMLIIRVASRAFLIGVGRKIEFVTRMNLYRHLLTMPRSFYDVQQTGELMSRLINDLTALRMFLGGGIMLMVNVLFAYLTVLPLMTMLNAKLTLLAFLLYPFVIGLMRILSMRVKKLTHQVQDRLGDLTAVAQENYSGMGVIQSYVKEKAESQRFYDASAGYFQANTQLVKTRAFLYVLIAMVSSLSVLVILGFGGREVILGGLSLSGFTAFMLYLERLSWPTVSFGWILSTFQQGIAATERINEIFEQQPTITDAQADPALSQVPAGPIEIRDLTFRYENPYRESEEQAPAVLKEISLTVQPGQLVAIVGPIGSGKTTLLNLLVRFYAPPAGTIRIGGVPIEHFPLAVLRRDISLMPQNAFLFSATIQDNIAFVNPQLELENVTDAAQTAQIHSEILGFPKAYATLVGERGVTLSGGQRQRSTLARTLLAEPQILLLDDPFSSVDAQTETLIIEAMEARRKRSNKTTIFSSQRFALVRQADQIIVLNAQGEIDAIGTHDQLCATSALYQSLNRTEMQEVAS